MNGRTGVSAALQARKTQEASNARQKRVGLLDADLRRSAGRTMLLEIGGALRDGAANLLHRRRVREDELPKCIRSDLEQLRIGDGGHRRGVRRAGQQ